MPIIVYTNNDLGLTLTFTTMSNWVFVFITIIIQKISYGILKA